MFNTIFLMLSLFLICFILRRSRAQLHMGGGGGVEMMVSLAPVSAGAYTATFNVMVNRVKGGGRDYPPPPTITSQDCFYHHDGMYARKRPLPLCVYSVVSGFSF
jgi:hypothetical protein